MKVILLAPLPPPAGGIAGWTQRMTEVELKNHWQVKVVDEKVIGGRSVFGKESKRNLFTEVKRCFIIWHNLSRELKQKDSKVVQSCIPAGTTSMLREIVCAIITKLHRKKFIVHFRCTLPNMVKTKVSVILFKMLVALSDCVFVLNKASDKFVEKNAPKTKRFIIPNFIESSSLYRREDFRERIEVLTYVGGVIPEKGCDLILSLAKHFPNKKFKLIGKIGMNKSIFPNNVVLLGEQPKEVVQDELRNSDVFLFLSRFSGEGFSNALAEAMAFSLPCIVSDWAANADMIENKGGAVIDDYSIESIVKAIKELEGKEIRRKCGQWNYSKVLNEYTDNIITSKYVDAYEGLVR